MKQYTTPKWLLKLENKILKDWGERCGEYEPFCHVCRLWEAMSILEDLYNKSIKKEGKGR